MSSFHSKSKIGQINIDETQLRMPQETLFYEKKIKVGQSCHTTHPHSYTQTYIGIKIVVLLFLRGGSNISMIININGHNG